MTATRLAARLPDRARSPRTVSALIACLLVGYLVLGRGDEVRAEAGDEQDRAEIRVGSKAFTESVVLGEAVTQLLREGGAEVKHLAQLGGTQVLWKALLNGNIDVYPEYTGTLRLEILQDPKISSEAELRAALLEKGIRMSSPLGFNNTYALGMLESRAGPVRTISDLREHPDLKLGFSTEFMERPDGWPGMRAAYRLPHQQVQGLNHDLAYRGLESGAIDVIDLYSTDAEIEHYRLRVLADDAAFFPQYKAVLLYRDDLAARAPAGLAEMLQLEGRIDAEAMIALNSRVKLQHVPEPIAAADFLRESLGVHTEVEVESRTERLLRFTGEHLYLVLISATAAILFAVPLGILAARNPAIGQLTLGFTGVLQTIPSLALLVILIPLLGVGPAPAICALFLYSLLPIVRNTYAGLHEIPLDIHESAQALGLSSSARLSLIELPMASRSILSGIKTAIVINIGTATLGGFIGAGGYGQPIFRGLRLDRSDLILEGAIPAALMALAAQSGFELVERYVVPRGLRLKQQQ